MNHCVTTSIYHFSNYILTAQNLVLTNNPPTIGGATFFPGQFYQAKIPASDIFVAGLEYYIEVYDSLNARVTRPTTAPTSLDTISDDVRDSLTPIRFQNTITRMTAGFSRDLTIQVKGNSSATYYPVPAETMTFAGGKGGTSRPNWLSARYTAQVNAGTTTALDKAGYDAFNNFIFVHPIFTSEPIIGAFGDPFSEFGKFTASYPPTDKTGIISVSLGGFTSTYNILVKGFGILCPYDVGTFDSTCIFN